MNSFAERLAYARKKSGHTQESLAAAIGVSRGVTNNLELGRTDNPQKIVINAICNELNINKEWLLHGTGEMDAADASQKSLDTLKRLSASLSEDEILYLIEHIRLMRKYNVIEKDGHKTRPIDEMVKDAESRQTEPRSYGKSREKEI